jgi:hypothetical protein
MGMHTKWTSGALVCTNSALGAAVNGITFYAHVANPNNQSGMSAYFEADISGTTAGHCYGLGSWINTEGTSPVLAAGHIIVPFEGGVYCGEAQATARIVFAGQHQAILAGAPASIYAWRLNVSQNIGRITALIAAANPEAVGWVDGAGTSGTQVGYIPIADIVSKGKVFVRCYSSAT